MIWILTTHHAGSKGLSLISEGLEEISYQNTLNQDLLRIILSSSSINFKHYLDKRNILVNLWQQLNDSSMEIHWIFLGMRSRDFNGPEHISTTHPLLPRRKWSGCLELRVQVVFQKYLTIRSWSPSALRDIFQANGPFSCGTIPLYLCRLRYFVRFWYFPIQCLPSRVKIAENS